MTHAVARNLAQIPIGLDRDIAIAGHGQQVAGWQLVGIAIDAARRRHVGMAQIAGQRRLIHLGAERRMGT